MDIAEEVSMHAAVMKTERSLSLVTQELPVQGATQPELASLMTSLRIQEGGQAIFQCQFSSNPPPVVTWFFNKKPINFEVILFVQLKKCQRGLTLSMFTKN